MVASLTVVAVVAVLGAAGCGRVQQAGRGTPPAPAQAVSPTTAAPAPDDRGSASDDDLADLPDDLPDDLTADLGETPTTASTAVPPTSPVPAPNAPPSSAVRSSASGSPAASGPNTTARDTTTDSLDAEVAQLEQELSGLTSQ